MAFTKEQILELERKLAELPEFEKTENLNKLESLKLMHSTIVELKNRGYTTIKIAEFLTNNGFDISSSLLTSYMSLLKKKRSRRPKKLDEKTKKINQYNSNNIENMPTIEKVEKLPESTLNAKEKTQVKTSAFVNLGDSDKL